LEEDEIDYFENLAAYSLFFVGILKARA